MFASPWCSYSFFFNDADTTEIYTLSLHDALPICFIPVAIDVDAVFAVLQYGEGGVRRDRKSTRLNSSHQIISYAVFCLKKKKEQHLARRLPSTISSIVGHTLRVLRRLDQEHVTRP